MIDFRITAQDLPEWVEETERAKVGRKGGYLLGHERSALLQALSDGLPFADAQANKHFGGLLSIGLVTADGAVTAFGQTVMRNPYVHPTAAPDPRMASAALDLATKEEMEERIRVLSDEMDASDEENRAMQAEIDALYAKIDALN